MQHKVEANRYIQLTDAGLKRLEEAMRRYRLSIDDIAGDRDTPSRNTVKRVLRKGLVFLNTLDRIWDYLQRCAAEKQETLAYLRRGDEYRFVEGVSRSDEDPPNGAIDTPPALGRRGWISRNVPRRNRLFTGRRDVLDRLHGALGAGPAALIQDPAALTGLGGIGKTQTATAYIYEHLREYNGVFWVTAETVEELNDGLAGMADELNLLDSVQATRSAALRKMHDWFQSESGWLLVLDNVDEIGALAPHFPRYHNGSLLLTTRSRNTVRWAAPIELAKFGRKDGALLLLRRAGLLEMSRKLDDAPHYLALAAMELVGELDGLPLAIDQAGAYVAETGVPVADYLIEYRRRGLELLDKIDDGDHKPVTLTFQLALEQLAKRGPFGAAAVEMVRLCAFLAPDAIPEPIVAAYPFSREGLPTSSDVCAEVIAAVCGYSLLSQAPRNKTLNVHRLVQKVTRDAMSDEERRTWTERAIDAVAEATPDFEFDDWPLCDLLLPHWRLCAEAIRDLRIETSRSAYLVYQAGRYLRVRAQYGEAESLLRLAVEIAEKVLGPDDPITADYLDALACLYRELDRFEDAELLHERALAIVEAADGPEHPNTAAKLHNLALFRVTRLEYSRAEVLFKRVLSIREK